MENKIQIEIKESGYGHFWLRAKGHMQKQDANAPQTLKSYKKKKNEKIPQK